MPVTPSGMISFPLAALAELLSECSAFQSWVGAAGAAEALGSVKYLSQDDDADSDSDDRPLAVVGWSDDFEAVRDSEPPRYDHSGSLELIFEAMADAGGHTTQSDRFFNFANSVGAVMAELEEKSGRNGFLLVNAFRKIAGPGRPSAKALNAGRLDVIGMVFEIDWAER